MIYLGSSRKTFVIIIKSGEVMKNLYSCCLVLALFTAMIGQNCEATTLAKDDQNLAQKIFETIDKRGQAELCKEGGILRGAAKKDGTILKVLGTPGANCNRNETFARIALAACGGNADFDKSQCSINAKRILGGYKSPKAVDDLKEAIKSGNQVVKTAVCMPSASKLSGDLSKVAAACAPQRPSTAAPTTGGVSKQQVKAAIANDQSWIDALLKEVETVSASTAGRTRKVTVSGKTVTLPPIRVEKKSEFVQALRKAKENLRKVEQSVEAGPDMVPQEKAETIPNYMDTLNNLKNDQEFLDTLDEEEKYLLREYLY